MNPRRVAPCYSCIMVQCSMFKTVLRVLVIALITSKNPTRVTAGRIRPDIKRCNHYFQVLHYLAFSVALQLTFLHMQIHLHFYSLIAVRDLGKPQ